MVVQVPTESNQTLQQAETALQQNRFEDAKKLYRKLLDSNFLPGVMHFRLGVIANLQGDYELALKEHQDAFQVDPALAQKIFPQGSPLHRWVHPGKFDSVETKQCAVCGSKKRKTINVINCLPMPTYHTAIDPVRVWVKCEECSHAYPKFRPSDAVLKQIYTEAPPAHLLVWNYNHILLSSEILTLLQNTVASGALLDVGCAAGVLPGVARDFGYQATGMDIHPIYKDNVERFGVNFIEGDFGSHDFGKQKYDIIAFGDVLEHMLDLKKAMKTVGNILNKKGVVWISTPNYDAAWTRIMGANDPMWAESEHLQYFSKKSLEKLLQDHGFKITDYRVSKRYQGSIEVLVER